jgi:cephalosporin hydroxylase
MRIANRAFFGAALILIVFGAGCGSRHPAVPPGPDVAAYRADPGVSFVEPGNPIFESRLARGFYWGTAAWRWTAPTFAVLLDPPEPPQPTWLTLQAAAPRELLNQTGPVTLTARVNGIEVGKHEFRQTGTAWPVWAVPAQALTRKPALVEFQLDKAAEAGKGGPERMPQGQPFGLIVVSTGLVVDEDKPISHATAVNLALQGYARLVAEGKHKLAPEKRLELLKLFHEVPAWSNMWFQNVKIEKIPLDLWMVQQIIYEVQPEFIVETGTWRGGSALYWAHMLNDLGLVRSRVLTVDIQNVTANAATNPLWKTYVRFLQGSSTDPRIVSTIAQQVRGRRTLVMLDSDHSMKHVLDELHAYAPMVSRGSYVIVEDTHLDGVPTDPSFGPGPAAAVKAFLGEPAGKDFIPDETREAFIITFNPGGWLRRK